MKFVDLFGLMELLKFLQCITIMKWKKKNIVLRILAVMSFTVNVCCAVSSGSQMIGSQMQSEWTTRIQMFYKK